MPSTVYLASPGTQQQAQSVADMPVLLSYGVYRGKQWIEDYVPSFSRVLIDSGAFSEMSSGKAIVPEQYMEWCEKWKGKVDAIAGLDDIRGDWRKSLDNYERFPLGFPTFHDTDPPELLIDLIDIAQENSGWIGLGLMPPRQSKEDWVRRACDRIPPGIHVHGWALRLYAHVARLDSMDSTNWWRDGMKYRQMLPWLTYGEALEIAVKRYKRETRITRDRGEKKPTPLFSGEDD